jgi:predicted N-acyltransferase
LNSENSLSFKIFNYTGQLPKNWNDLAIENIFLSTNYLKILEQSAPTNMICHFIGIFQQEELVGIATSQFIDANQLASFGNREKCLKTYFRDFILKNFASHVLFVGNNMLTGQNAFAFSDKIKAIEGLRALKNACEELKTIFKKQRKNIHLTIFKDFSENEIVDFTKGEFNDFYQFSIQPNMVFDINYEWKTEQNYVDALTKKYRDQYKRARKKAIDIEKSKLNYEEILANEALIYDLYFHVAKNAPFNTFFLSKNHFSNFKFILKDNFLFYGYFLDQKMIGFNTLIKNGNAMDTYFLGYDESIQKDKMLYLNMLYDMIAYSINKGFKEIVFARTALEIKSSVGAKPQKMFGFIEHSNALINRFMPTIFPFIEPNVVWQERNPFK